MPTRADEVQFDIRSSPIHRHIHDDIVIRVIELQEEIIDPDRETADAGECHRADGKFTGRTAFQNHKGSVHRLNIQCDASDAERERAITDRDLDHVGAVECSLLKIEVGIELCRETADLECQDQAPAKSNKIVPVGLRVIQIHSGLARHWNIHLDDIARVIELQIEVLNAEGKAGQPIQFDIAYSQSASRFAVTQHQKGSVNIGDQQFHTTDFQGEGSPADRYLEIFRSLDLGLLKIESAGQLRV